MGDCGLSDNGTPRQRGIPPWTHLFLNPSIRNPGIAVSRLS
jgi:hypothetical protein